MLTVSDTAYTVAVARAEEGELPATERLFDDPYATIFRAAGGHAAEATARLLALPLVRAGVRLRTRFIDDFLREGLSAGVTQVVLFGAGFDARGLRMPEIAATGARVYEVDFAPQLEKKRALLAAAGVPLPGHVAHVACDFMAADFAPALTVGLETAGFGRDRGALFVWEGVTPYIDDPAVDRSLTFMAGAGGRGTRVVFDYGAPRFDPVSAAERTRRASFTAFDEVDGDVLWRRYLPGEPPPMASILRMGVATGG
jgi:methyltransferase (TIGR00027 family)